MTCLKNIFLIFLVCITTNSFAQSYDEISIDSLEIWIEQRVENSKNGVQEIVKMPFVVRSLAWGCVCPEYYIGVSPNTLEGPWISPVLPKEFPTSDENGHSLVVIGRFTGKMITLELDSHFHEESNDYVLPEFQIISWNLNNEGYDVQVPKVVQ